MIKAWGLLGKRRALFRKLGVSCTLKRIQSFSQTFKKHNRVIKREIGAVIFTRTFASSDDAGGASSDDAANQSTYLFSISLLHRRLPSLFFRRTCNWGEEGSGQVLIVVCQNRSPTSKESTPDDWSYRY